MRGCNQDEVVDIDGDFTFVPFVVKESWGTLECFEAEGAHDFVKLFVPNGAAFRVTIQGFSKDTDRVMIFRGTV